MGCGGWLIYIRVWVGGQGVSIIYFFLVRLYFVTSCSQSLYLGGWKMVAVVSVSLFFLYFLYLWSRQLGVTSADKLLCLLCKTVLKVSYLIIILWITLEKGECFDFNHSLGFIYPTLYTSLDV